MEIILIILVALIVFFFYRKNTKKSQPQTQVKTTPEAQIKPAKPKPVPQVEDTYKKKGIKNFKIVGVKNYNLNPQDYGGGGKGFIGYIQTVQNSHDKYAVGVFTHNNNQIGHTPKNNNRLSNSLNKWHNGKSIAWGNFRYDDYIKNWEGTVFSPIGFSSEEMEKIKNIITLRERIQVETKNTNNTTEGYFNILEKHREVKKDLEDLNYPTDLHYSFPANFIPTISKHLEQEKDWEKLLELERYDDLINELNERYKTSTLKRIEKAKAEVQ